MLAVLQPGMLTVHTSTVQSGIFTGLLMDLTPKGIVLSFLFFTYPYPRQIADWTPPSWLLGYLPPAKLLKQNSGWHIAQTLK